MAKTKKLSRADLRTLIRMERTFFVNSVSERGLATTMAKDMGLSYTTRVQGNGFVVFPTPRI